MSQYGVDSGYGFGWKVMAGSITPVWNPGGLSAAQYIFTDSTGAEYNLNQQSGNIWNSQQSTYVWFDANANILHNRDGSFWTFGCISGAGWTNSSSRISQIEGDRAVDEGGTYYTYLFGYNNNTPPHLTSITNTIGTGEAYGFSYQSASGGIQDPFLGHAHGASYFLESTTLSNIGTSYQFTTNQYGELTEIQLPYKGTLQYAYTTTNYGDGLTWRELTSRTLSTCNSAGQGCESGSGQYTISHESSPGYDVHQFALIEDPGGVGEKYWAFNSSGTYEGLASTYQGRDRNAGGPGNCLSGNSTGSGMCKVENDFTWTQDTAGDSYIGQVTNTLDPGTANAVQNITSQTQTHITGNVATVVNGNYSGYMPSSRTLNYTYTYQNYSAYTPLYIYNRVQTATETDGTSNLTLASMTYDCGYGCVGSGYSPNPREWDVNYATVGYRGNPTTSATLNGTSTASYDRYGNVISSSNSNGVGSASTMTSGTNYAAPGAITVGGSLTTSLTYASAGFLGISSATGPNGTTVDIGYDANARPTSSTSPFGATTTTHYNDTASPPNSCTMVDGRWTQTNLDGLGRPILAISGNGSSCGQGNTVSQSETTYGPCGCTPVGKMISQTVPHAPGSPGATTTYTYDGVGRTLSKAVVGTGSSPDTQGTTSYLYQGNTITVTDPAGKWKIYTTDGFGNLVQVAEPNPGGGSNYTTSYTYDVLNHLINVSMPRSTGTQTRSWTYSGVFLMSATNPENGAVSYTYGSNNLVATKTDAKGQVTTYSYDWEARLSQVQHYPTGLSNGADPCQTVNYSYDGNNPLGSGYPQNASGHLSAIQYYSGVGVPSAYPGPSCITTFTELYNYGVPGAPTGKQLTVTRNYEYQEDTTNIFQNFNVNLNATYTYDTEGRVTNETYPTDSSGNTANLGYTFDSMGRLNTMTDNIANQQLIQSATYGPANELTNVQGGSYFGARASETRTYNSIKQLTSISVYGAIEASYTYPSSNNDGKISSQSDAISGETVTYTYDALNRLASATNSGASPSWGQSFAYDGFGNMTQTAVTQGSAPTFTQTYNANNKVGNEDANGNPPSVPLPAYGSSATPTYDVENRLVQLSQYGNPYTDYAYDPANHRVWRYNPNNTPATDEITFWSITGQKLGTYQVTYNAGNGGCCYGEGNYQAPQFTVAQTAVNLYFGAKLIKDNNGWVYPDRLGSIGKFYPYGIERPSATTNDTEKFTGYFRDAESGNDYAVNRYQSPGYGRFLTPDPSHSSAGPSDPGSWNKYAYTRGDPVNRVDRGGTCDTGDEFDDLLGTCDDDEGDVYDEQGDVYCDVDRISGCDPDDPNVGGGSGVGDPIDPTPTPPQPTPPPNPPVSPPAPSPTPAPAPPPTGCGVVVSFSLTLAPPCISVLPIVPVGIGGSACKDAINDLSAALQLLNRRLAEIARELLAGKKPDEGHLKPLRQELGRAKAALQKALSACGEAVAIGAAEVIAAAEAAIAAAEEVLGEFGPAL